MCLRICLQKKICKKKIWFARICLQEFVCNCPCNRLCNCVVRAFATFFVSVCNLCVCAFATCVCVRVCNLCVCAFATCVCVHRHPCPSKMFSACRARQGMQQTLQYPTQGLLSQPRQSRATRPTNRSGVRSQEKQASSCTTFPLRMRVVRAKQRHASRVVLIYWFVVSTPHRKTGRAQSP